MFLDWGLFGLFIGCFLSATVIPFSSDLLLSAALLAGYPAFISLVVATVGNFLGTITNYWIGRLIALKKKNKPKKTEKWNALFKKFGPLIGLIAWVPLIGEPLVIVLGYLKVPFWTLSIFILIGVFGRYLIWFYLFGN